MRTSGIKMIHFRQGFTIVELLIVIVVIAILAAISIVAYNGIQDRSNNTTVQADMRNTNAAIMAAKTLNDGAPPTPNQAGLENVIKVSRGSYLGRENDSFVYCRTDKEFGLIAISKSGQTYSSKNGSPVREVSDWGGSSTSNACSANSKINIILPATDPGFGYLAIYTNNTWPSWL